MRERNICILIALIAMPFFVSAQWLNQRTPGIPRTLDGKPNLSAPTPRAGNGKPDLSGLWQTDSAPPEVLARLLPGGTNNGSSEDLPSQYFLNILYDYKPEEAPLQPAAAVIFRQRARKLCQGVSAHALSSDGRADGGDRTGTLQDCPRSGNDGDALRKRYHLPPGVHRRPKASRRSIARLDGVLGRQMGRRFVGGRYSRAQRSKLAGCARPHSWRCAAPDR